MDFKNIRSYITLLFVLRRGIGFSQTIQSLDCLLKYDSTTFWYDFHIILLDGYAEGAAQRTHFGSQITLVIPTGATIAFADKYMPLENNQNYSGDTPMDWSFGLSVSDPASSPGNDFISIAPNLSPSSQYNNIYAADTIKLFRVSVSGDTNCEQGIRLFDNAVDPGSDAPGMGGGDFSNEFTIGGSTQLYNENAPIEGPMPPEILELTDNSGTNIDINLEISGASCQGTIEYMWTGPNGYTSTTEDVFIDPAISANFGEYEVIVVDAIGCADTTSIIVDESVPTVTALGFLDINNEYVLSNIDGSVSQVLTTDGNGIVSWMDAPTSFVGDSPTDNDQRWSGVDTISSDSKREIDSLKNEVVLLKSEIEALKLLIEKLTKD
ncbi:MAG: hypothetical protein ACJATI_004975 [Halioglobus sp.]|jgi:hypothetical protein